MKTANKPFPYFVPNQLLRAQQLNDLVSFLDENSRFTNVFSLGIGIVSGLAITNVEMEGPAIRSITVSEGFGLSSDGFLFRLNDDCVLTHYRKIDISTKAFDCVPQEERFTLDNLKTFYQLREEDDIPVGERDLYKPLLDFPVPDSNGNSDVPDLKCLTMVMLSSLDVKERAVCFNECDEDSRESSVTTKILLADAQFVSDKIKEPGTSSSSGDSRRKAGDPPYIHRFAWDNEKKKITLANIRDFASLADSYKTLSQEAVGRIKATYEKVSIDFAIWDEAFNTDELTSTLQQCLDNLLASYPTTGASVPYDFQYLYDHMKDLVAAYLEFADSLRELDSSEQFIPNLCQFPGFIALGRPIQRIREAVTEGNGTNEDGTVIESPFSCPPVEKTRTNFQSASLNELQLGNLQRAQFYLNRLGKLCPFAVLLPTINLKEIKITASRGRHLPLSQRAIPFYYSPGQNSNNERLRNFWNFELSRDGQSERIPSYHRFSSIAPFDEHLNYDVEAYQFFRIEGHVGNTLGEVAQQVDELRSCFNLPFDIKCVKLGGQAEEDIKKADMTFRHLELLYENTRCDVIDTRPSLASELPATEGDESGFVRLLQELETNPDLLNRFFENEALDCYYEFLRRLVAEHTELIQEVLFHDFVRKHPGTEHFGGVPKGGTFIIAYIDEAAVVGTPTAVPPPVKRVVADFCLPYHCCDGLPPASFIIEPFIFIFPKEFCKGDLTEYEVIVYPSGGELTGSVQATGANSYPYIKVENGKHYFIPDGVPDSAFDANGIAVVELINTYNGLEAKTSVTIESAVIEEDNIEVILSGFPKDADCNIYRHIILEWGGNQEVSNWKIDGADLQTIRALDGNEYTVAPLKENVVVSVEVRTNENCVGKAEKTINTCPDILSFGFPNDGNWNATSRKYTIAFEPNGQPALAFDNYYLLTPEPVDPVVVNGLNVSDYITDNFSDGQGTPCEERLTFFAFNDPENDLPSLPPGDYQFKIRMETPCVVESEILTVSIVSKENVIGNGGGEENISGGSDDPNGGDSGSEVAVGESDGNNDSGNDEIRSAETETDSDAGDIGGVEGRNFSPPRKPAGAAILNARTDDRKAILKTIEEEGVLVSKASFANAMSFIFTSGGDLKENDKDFNKAAKSLIGQFKNADQDKANQAKKLLYTTLHSYLDKQVFLSPNEVLKATEKVLKTIVEKMKGIEDLSLQQAKRRWKGTELKKGLKAAAVDAYFALLK